MYLTHAEYEVEDIVSEQVTSKGLEYQIKWKQFDEVTWEPFTNLHWPQLLKVGLPSQQLLLV